MSQRKIHLNFIKSVLKFAVLLLIALAGITNAGESNGNFSIYLDSSVT